MREYTAKGFIWILCAITLVFLICTVFLWVAFYSQNGSDHFFGMNVLIGRTGLIESESTIIDRGETEEFSFVSFEPFNELEIYIENKQETDLDIRLMDEEWNTVANKKYHLSSETDRFVPVLSDLKITEGRRAFVLRIDNTGTAPIKVASLNGGTAVRSNDGFPFVLAIYIFINICIYISFLGCIYVLFYRRKGLNKVFLVVVIPLVVVFSILLYPGTTCDENDHYVEAYMLSNRIMGIEGNIIRAEDAGIINSRWAVPNLEGVYLGATQTGHRAGNADMVENTHQGHVGKDIVYILPALGITVSRKLGLNAFTTYYLARAMNVLMYIAVGYLALTIAKFGNGILFCFLLLPLVINQCISVNQDSFCFAMSFLAIAYWTRLCEKMGNQKRKLSIADIIIVFLLFVVLLSCKAYVLIMAVYCILPWNEAYGTKWRKIVAVAGTGALVFAVLIGVVEITGHGGYASHLIRALIGSANSSSYSLIDFKTKPAEFIMLVVRTVREQGFQWFWDAFGSRLSWETYFSPLYAICFTVLIVLVALFDGEGHAMVSRVGKIMIVAINVVFFAIVVVRALSWTSKGRETIWGIQGRYFIPMLPLLFMNLVGKEANNEHVRYKTLCLASFVLMLSVLCIDFLNLHIMRFLVE